MSDHVGAAPVVVNDGARSFARPSPSNSIPKFLAYAAGVMLMGASAAINVRYALAKSDDPTMQAVWAGVAVAASIALALAPSAFVASLSARRYGSAALCLLAALIFGAYSVTAALGAATGGRLVAAIEADDVAEKRATARKRLADATTELAALSGIRPSAVVQAEISAVYTRTPGLAECRDHDPNWRPTKQHREACKTIAALEVEKASADRKAELSEIIHVVQNSLDGMKAGRTVANADAVALKSFGDAFGLTIAADTWNRLLVVLAVLVVEFGGGLAFALAPALGSVTADRSRVTEIERRHVEATQKAPSATVEPLQPVTPCHLPTPLVSLPGPENRASDSVPLGVTSSAAVLDVPEAVGDRLVALVRDRGGELVGGLRTFGRALGVSHTEVSRVLGELTAAGRVEVEASKSGTRVRLQL